ncbi:MAG: radical SAM protein [Promethearchaeia archaeon]
MKKFSCCIEITTNCDLNCKHCFLDFTTNEKKDMELEMFEYIIQSLKLKSLSLYGGEPLLHPQFKEIINILKQKRIKYISLFTNGMNLNDDILTFLERNLPKIELLVSLDGFKETHDFIRNKEGSFERVVNNIKNATHRKFKVIINLCLNKLNASKLEEFFLFAKKLGVAGIRTDMMLFEGRAKREMKEYFIDFDDVNEVKQNLANSSRKSFYREANLKKIAKCNAGVDYFYVTAYGDVYPCVGFRGIKEFFMGSLNKREIYDIIKNPEGDLIPKLFNFYKSKKVLDDCQGCSMWKYCMGGCRASAYKIFGTLDYLDPMRCAQFLL